MIKKKFKDISLDITEAEYRADGAIHYSALAAFERGGFHAVAHINDKKETDALTFGSIVDTMLTDSMEAFREQYHVTVMPDNMSSQIKNVVDTLFLNYQDSCFSIDEIPEVAILSILNDINYGKGWRNETRLAKVREPGREYYRQMKLAQGKTVISDEMYQDALNCVNALRTSPNTKPIFERDSPFSNIEHCYQFKFRAYIKLKQQGPVNDYNVVGTYGLSSSQEEELINAGYIPVTIMADDIIVNHEKKVIFPFDLKTSSHFEDEFYKSVADWNYYIQARLYYRVIKANMIRDPYFKEFELKDYNFVIVNKKSLVPLVWNYSDTQKFGTLYYGKNKQIIAHDPYDLAVQLWHYIHDDCVVADGITLAKPNNLVEYLNNL